MNGGYYKTMLLPSIGKKGHLQVTHKERTDQAEQFSKVLSFCKKGARQHTQQEWRLSVIPKEGLIAMVEVGPPSHA